MLQNALNDINFSQGDQAKTFVEIFFSWNQQNIIETNLQDTL